MVQNAGARLKYLQEHGDFQIDVKASSSNVSVDLTCLIGSCKQKIERGGDVYEI